MDVFAAKLSSDGSTLLWSTFLGGAAWDRGHAIALDLAGNPILTGYTQSSRFPVTTGAYDTSHNGQYDAFVTKLSGEGSTLLWSTFLGGSGQDGCSAMGIDHLGNPVLAGSTESSGFPTTENAHDTSYNGDGDVFVSKMSGTGTTLLWSTFLGGEADEGANDLYFEPDGNLVLGGFTESSGFPTTPWGYDTSQNGDTDAYITVLSSTGSTILCGTFLGASSYDECRAFALDIEGNPVLTGLTESSGFPTTAGAYDTTYSGPRDVFVAKLLMEDLSGVVDIRSRNQGILFSCQPNPMRESAEFHYILERESPVTLQIYQIRGAAVFRLRAGLQAAGAHTVLWDGRNTHGQAVAPGVYLACLRAGDDAVTRRIVRLR
jgi:hypothetical protein